MDKHKEKSYVSPEMTVFQTTLQACILDISNPDIGGPGDIPIE